MGRAVVASETIDRLKQQAEDLLRVDARAALRLARRAARTGRASAEPRARALGEHILAKALHAAQRYREAADLYARAGKAYARLGLERERAAASHARVGALFHLGRFTDAEAEAQRALALFRRLGERRGAARVLVNLANVRHAQDRHVEALRLLERARPTLAALGDREALAGIDLNRANSYSLLARFDRSAILYRQAREVYAGLGMNDLVARVEYNLAYDHFLRGRVHQARRLLARVSEAFRRSGARHSLALAARDEAELALLLGQPERAREAAAEARRIFEDLSTPIESARATLLEAQAARSVGQEDEARRLLAAARAVFARHRHEVGLSDTDLALASFASDLPARRLRRARAAARCFAAHRLAGREATALVAAGHIAAGAGRRRAAETMITRALTLARKRGLPEAELRAEAALAALAREGGDAKQALVRYRRAIGAYERLRAGMRSDEDRLAFAADRSAVFAEAMATALDLGRVEEAFDLLERARSRALVDLLAADPDFVDAVVRSGGPLARRLRRLKQGSARLEAGQRDCDRRSASIPAGWSAALRQALAKQEETLAALVEQDPDVSYALAGRPVAGLEEIRAMLAGERALVAYFSEGPGFGALVIAGQTIRAYRGLARSREVERALAALRFALSPGRHRTEKTEPQREALAGAALAALAALRRLLLAPLEPALGDRPLVVVPHASLHWVPFQALTRAGEPLLAQREVTVAPSATVLLHASRRRPATARALVVAVPDDATPALADEALGVHALLGGRLLTGRSATAAALRRDAPRYRILHLAAHGVYEPSDPLLSGLDLADGRLTVPEVAALGLDAALVTLSACESGLGAARGDEVVGLTRALLHAGTRSLVVSLWSVSDRSTAELMAELYAGLGRGMGVAAALRRAALEVRRTHPDPYHWAAFQVVGSWARLI